MILWSNVRTYEGNIQVYTGEVPAKIMVRIKTFDPATDGETDSVAVELMSIEKIKIGSDDELVTLPGEAKIKVKFATSEQLQQWANLLQYPPFDYFATEYKRAELRLIMPEGPSGYDECFCGYIMHEEIRVDYTTRTMELSGEDESSKLRAPIINTDDVDTLNTRLLLTDIVRSNLLNARDRNGSLLPLNILSNFTVRDSADSEYGIESLWLLYRFILTQNISSFADGSPVYSTYGDIFKAICNNLLSNIFIGLDRVTNIVPRYYDGRVIKKIFLQEIVSKSIDSRPYGMVGKITRQCPNLKEYTGSYEAITAGWPYPNGLEEITYFPFPCYYMQIGISSPKIWKDNHSSSGNGSWYLNVAETEGNAFRAQVNTVRAQIGYNGAPIYSTPSNFPMLYQTLIFNLISQARKKVTIVVSGRKSLCDFYGLYIDENTPYDTAIYKAILCEYDFAKFQTKMTLLQVGNFA
jgi:hypothetical protein